MINFYHLNEETVHEFVCVLGLSESVRHMIQFMASVVCVWIEFVDKACWFWRWYPHSDDRLIQQGTDLQPFAWKLKMNKLKMSITITRALSLTHTQCMWTTLFEICENIFITCTILLCARSLFQLNQRDIIFVNRNHKIRFQPYKIYIFTVNFRVYLSLTNERLLVIDIGQHRMDGEFVPNHLR